MLTLVSDVFVNLCVLISLIFVYLQFRRKIKLTEKPYTASVLIDGLLGGLLGVLLMYFSIQVSTETIVDLRFVPVVLLILFLGTPQGIISALVIIMGRFTFGITVSAIAAATLMLILIIGFILISEFFKRFDTDANSYKKGFVMILFSNVVFSIIISSIIQDVEILTILIPLYWIISIIGGITAIFFVEYILKTQYLLMKYEEESTTDFLTGLNNVRQFDTVWNTLISEAAEKNERLSLLVIDIDHFKHVNDTYGHPVGDKILIELGAVLKSASRSFDIVSRNGGEEFSVILPDCQQEQAVKIAERIRKSVEIHPFKISATETITITISIGAATYPETVADTSQIVGIADECLYKAKRTGRNRVCASY
ncbi:diguanylate cyclase [Planococcus versutus]|uniref:diguanylate cyclase n=1 Tax=Planococcus versutus TaxID=1302659 RepID=UPI0009F8E0A4|nr:diguanylate cyclase [Planococcus versutus]